MLFTFRNSHGHLIPILHGGTLLDGLQYRYPITMLSRKDQPNPRLPVFPFFRLNLLNIKITLPNLIMSFGYCNLGIICYLLLGI